MVIGCSLCKQALIPGNTCLWEPKPFHRSLFPDWFLDKRGHSSAGAFNELVYLVVEGGRCFPNRNYVPFCRRLAARHCIMIFHDSAEPWLYQACFSQTSLLRVPAYSKLVWCVCLVVVIVPMYSAYSTYRITAVERFSFERMKGPGCTVQ